MRRVRRLSYFFVLTALVCVGCDEVSSDLVVERLPDVQPTIPEVPTLPPPPHPIQLADQSYTIYGVRKKMRSTMDSEVEVTGYIVNVYAPPECPRGETCPRPSAPHMFLADVAGEADETKWLMVVGYAENQDQLDTAMRAAARGAYKPPDPETGEMPIPTDFVLGNQVKLKGRFTRLSGAGFNNSEGLIEYAGHETLATAG